MNRLLFLTLYLLSNFVVDGQNILLSDLSGEELRTEIVKMFKPDFVELYTEAREILYTEIYNIDDSVHTIYTDHKIYLPQTELRPIGFLAMDGTNDGISAEHIYPRSKGAKEENGNAFSDMHNLAPARWEVNSVRSSFPFGEINDAETDIWFYQNEKLFNTSTFSNETINKYSEADVIDSFFEGFFEPRERVKGDIARSVFYFFTMYRDEAITADPNYFRMMQTDLCQWHNDDPVDEIESERNNAKSAYQEGKQNPFIVDCSLANRLYCHSFSTTCSNLTTTVNNISEGEFDLKPKVKIFPNPNRGNFTLDISSLVPGIYQIDIFGSNGKRMMSAQEQLDYFNTINLWNVKSGIYFLHIIDLKTGLKFSDSFQIIE